MIPKSVYLSRDKKQAYQLEGKKVRTYTFNSKIKLRKDSGIGLLAGNKIIAAGGTDSSGFLTSASFLIDIPGLKASNLPDLPIQMKEGSLYEYSDWIYYVGGTSDLFEMSESAPLLRYNRVEEFWEIFRPPNNEDVVSMFLDHPVTEVSNSKPKNPKKDFEITSLVHPGTFMIGSKIYFALGKRIGGKGKLKTNNCVFSLDLDQLVFRYEPFKIPLNISKPLCMHDGERVLILGGYDSKNVPNKKVYSLSLSEEIDIQELPDLTAPKRDNFPLVSKYDSVLCFLFPLAAVLKKGAWRTVDLNDISVKKKIKIIYERASVLRESHDLRSSFIISYKDRGSSHSSLSSWVSRKLFKSFSRSKKNELVEESSEFN